MVVAEEDVPTSEFVHQFVKSIQDFGALTTLNG